MTVRRTRQFLEREERGGRREGEGRGEREKRGRMGERGRKVKRKITGEEGREKSTFHYKTSTSIPLSSANPKWLPI